MAGKCRLLARKASSIMKAPDVLSRDWVTGSVKSPPGGDTDRIMLSEPVSPVNVSTIPALSTKEDSLEAR